MKLCVQSFRKDEPLGSALKMELLYNMVPGRRSTRRATYGNVQARNIS